MVYFVEGMGSEIDVRPCVVSAHEVQAQPGAWGGVRVAIANTVVSTICTWGRYSCTLAWPGEAHVVRYAYTW